jgi:hypothetical protein
MIELSIAKKPVVISSCTGITEGETLKAVLEFMDKTKCPYRKMKPGVWEMIIHTLEGDMHLSPQRLLVNSELQGGVGYPYKPNIFAAYLDQ